MDVAQGVLDEQEHTSTKKQPDIPDPRQHPSSEQGTYGNGYANCPIASKTSLCKKNDKHDSEEQESRQVGACQVRRSSYTTKTEQDQYRHASIVAEDSAYPPIFHFSGQLGFFVGKFSSQSSNSDCILQMSQATLARLETITSPTAAG